jgi:oxygen-independent coproporphyrinogen-3 oxidase
MTTETPTDVGSYFIANYPPFSLWESRHVPEIHRALTSEPDKSVTMGLYIHIPFCRKRCKFCYFRVYTNQNAQAIENYVQALEHEFELLSRQPGVRGRTLRFAYFGGGTPSYLSSKQLRSLHDRLSEYLSWETAEEVTFECEPGTLSLEKVKTLKDIGVTRVSLGVENFNDEILENNGRAHLSPEIFRAYDWLQQVGFPQINVDLIAGMIGESDENWADCVEKVKQLEPDNITIYQMELPHNTLISREIKELGVISPIAGWAIKRRWVSEAMDTLLSAGYHISSGNELGHFQGVHYQNFDQLEQYIQGVASDELPIHRALVPTKHQELIREVVLQLKEGRISARPYRAKFGVDILQEFATPLRNQEAAGYLAVEGDEIRLTRRGLLQVDTLLPEYFEEEHRAVRYT